LVKLAKVDANFGVAKYRRDVIHYSLKTVPCFSLQRGGDTKYIARVMVKF
jgi:hypothetical protein